MGKTKTNYNEKDKAIVTVLKGAETPMTMKEIAKAAGVTLVAGNLTGAMAKGLIAVAGEAVVERPAKKNVSTYVLVTNEPTLKADGKVNAYSENEKAILGVLETAKDALTLAEIGELLNKTLTSGNINGLVRKGNVTKGEEKEVETVTKGKVKTYEFVADIPTDIE